MRSPCAEVRISCGHTCQGCTQRQRVRHQDTALNQSNVTCKRSSTQEATYTVPSHRTRRGSDTILAASPRGTLIDTQVPTSGPGGSWLQPLQILRLPLRQAQTHTHTHTCFGAHDRFLKRVKGIRKRARVRTAGAHRSDFALFIEVHIRPQSS